MAPSTSDRSLASGSTFPLANYQAQAHHDSDAQGSPFAALISTGSLPAGTNASASSSCSTTVTAVPTRPLQSTSAPSPSLSVATPTTGNGPSRTAQLNAHNGPKHTFVSEASYTPDTPIAKPPAATGSTAADAYPRGMSVTARAALDSTSTLQTTTSSTSPTAGPAAHGSAFWAMTRQLQTRLRYARLKVDHGWQKQNLNEVENLYFRQLQRGQREARERERANGTKKQPRRERATTISEKDRQAEKGDDNVQGNGGHAAAIANTNDARNITTLGSQSNAMGVDLEPPPESTKDQPLPNVTHVSSTPALHSQDPPNAGSSTIEAGASTAPQTQQDTSTDSPAVSQPPPKRPTATTQSASVHPPSSQKPSTPAPAPAATTASAALTYDSFWSSVSSQRPNLASITAQVAANSKGTGTSSSSSSSSGTGAGYQGYQNLQSFQALQAFRAALAGNATGEGSAGSQAVQMTNSTASQSQKPDAPNQSDTFNAFPAPDGAGSTQN